MQFTKPQKLICNMEKFAEGAIAVICGSMLINGKKDLSELKRAVNEIYRLNDALRIRISETDGEVSQSVSDYTERDINVLCFENKAELDSYAENYAKIPFDFYGNLCDIRIVTLPEQYGLLVKFHHIVGDAWTIALIGTQFNTLVNGESVESYSYTDYLESENAYLTGNRYEKDKTYFLEQFKKCDEVTYLSEKQSESLNACRKTFVIDKDKTKQINDYARKNETSVFMLFTATLSAYINRTKMNAERFYIGTAVLNRNGTKEKNTMGMFVNSVPMLIELDNSKTFAENLSSVQKTAFSIFRHQKYNYGDVLSTIRKEFNFTEKLYDAMISYQNATITGADIETTWYHSGVQSESLQIHIDDRDNEGIFRIHYDYQTEKFTEYDIDMLHQHICSLLFDAVKNDTKKLYELELLTADEQQKLLYDFNDTAIDYRRDKCIHQLFEEQAAKMPYKTAVIACDKTLTYKELNEQANRIAHSLIQKGVKVGDIVAFALPRKSYLIAAIFGILKSGAAYLPIDPDYPQDRIDYMLSDSKAKLFITEDNISELLNNSNINNPCVSMTSDDLCYCIYTSGSTGKPKGAVIRHRNLANFCNHRLPNNLQHYIKNNCNTVLACGSITFDISNFEIVLSLLLNKSVVLASEKELTNTNLFAGLIKKNQIDCVHCTPTKLHTYLENKIFANAFESVKCVMVGGEQLTEEVCNTIKKHCDAAIFNGYGPTETTMGVGFGDVNQSGITIGKPIANTQIYIVDKYMHPTPIGVTGELCIAGDGVGAGYLNRPELTAEKFIDNPFGKGKLYKTGDLAYWREDGNIVYVGRNDFQVKIRGLRIELGEIENAICSINGISQAVVVVRKNNEGRQLICAFYTGTETDAKEIRSHIGKKLPKYMLPHIFTHLDEMPLTSSGKFNRKALPEVDLYAMDTAVEYVAPQTELENILVSAVEVILSVDKVGIMDNFFDIGGDSLKAIELISKLEKQGYHTDTKTIFDCDTIKELAQRLTVADTAEEVFDFSGDIPATDAQMRVYTAQSMQENSTTYNVPYVFKVDEVDIDRLQTAVNKLIDRHEILRAHFENKDGTIIQVIDSNAVCQVEQICLPLTRGADMKNLINTFVRPFDLSKAPLLRVGAFENTVMMDMHHIITDGSSMPVFFKELNELYMDRELNNTPVQYKRFAIENQDHTESEKYWLSVYSDEIPVLEINTDFKRGQKQTFNGSAIYDTVDIELHNKILAFCKEQNITPYVFYMAAFNILLSKFSGNEDIIVGMPMSGRDAKYLDTIGMFVNTIALRNKPVGTKTVVEFLQEVKENSVHAINHQDYPYGKLVKKLNANTTERNPLFDVMFAYQSEQMTDIVFGDKKAELLPIPVTTSKYDFTFNIMPRASDVVIMAEYCTDLYKENTMQRFVDGYKQILSRLLDGKAALKDISAISKQEQHKLLYDFNDTVVDYPRDKCIHQLFEEQAEKTPDKTAVIACDKTLTYRELNEEANRIAHSLIEKGVGVGDIVAFMLPRRSYLIATMLGILKSGAAYMPIDPDYPKDRIDYMLFDSAAKLCITDANISELLNHENENNPCVDMTSENLCYCIYTSGSTGKPKGVIIRHYNLTNFCDNNNNNLQTKAFQEGNKVLSIFKSCFDAFGCDSILMLLNEKTIILVSDSEIYEYERIAELIVNENIDIMHATPSIMNNLCTSKAIVSKMMQLKVIMLGAENFNPTLYNFICRHTNANIFNGYGPTETTIGVCFGEVINSDITIGKPIANTQIYIVDKYMKQTPIGVTGELCIAGDGVGAGYLNRPELTAEKFIDNPFGKGKLYKTGDLAYFREDGNIVYVGRNDFQVKIRGLRIELGEIENAICGINGISQAVVVVRKNTEGRQLICAFYTGNETDAKEIRSHIGKKLPKYMLPHIFTHLDEMPLTSSGKINRKALPEINLENTTNDTEYVAPENEQQKELCKLIESVLGTTPVGITDDFFDLGGDSLKAIEFVSKAHNEGIYFNLQNIFDYPTVNGLCECIENGDKQVISFADVDFTEVNGVLEKNKVEYITEPQKCDVGNILLAGATGFLGIHILADYLDNDTGSAYCLVRGKDKTDSTNRLKELLNFYFGDKYAAMNRIEVICADLQKDKFGLSDEKYADLLGKVDTVINCAASVKHYGSYKYFYEANVETTKRLIAFCKDANAKLIHTSTLSVSGNTFGDAFDGYISETEKHFYESSLYIDQPLDNVYGRSKFEAEKAVLDAMCEGLQANIMRMGNLTNRISDGQFQKNHESNAFLQRVKGVLELGLFPEYLIKDTNYAEFTPIDEAANAVMTIVRHFSTEQTVFHINSIKVVYFDKLVEIINRLGYDLKLVSGTEFTEALRQTAKQAGMEHIFETFINDMDENDQLNYDSNIRIENDFTVQYLKTLGFEWSDIGIEYLRKYVEYFKKIGYIE